LRVVVWNMAANSVSRAHEVHERGWRHLERLDPDVALLQEAAVPAWARDRWTVHSPSPDRWGSVVAAKTTLGLEPAQADIPHALATATVGWTDGVDLLLISAYAPPVKATEAELGGRDPASVRLPRYRTVWSRDAAYAVARDAVRPPFLVAGDWNTSPQLDDELHPWKHEGDFFTRAADDGWVDCYRRFHDREGRSWFGAGHAPYQFDHAFCDPATATVLRSCEIDAHPAEDERLSDHAPLILEIGTDGRR
jgi:exonuclease III